jgi:glycosyltransferase involved in cell wall biosynthesis
MPVFEAEAFVAEAVESILQQTFADFEFLIFDDGSSDSSARIIQSYAAADARIRFFSKPHLGYTRWLNEGVTEARGEFVARMDADDVSLPERLAAQVDFLRQRSDVVVTGCNILLMDMEGAPISRQVLPTDHETIERLLLDGVPGQICHPAALIRRDALRQVGGYRVEYETVEDYDLLLRLAEVGKLANLPQVLLRYRLHGDSVGFTRRAEQLRWSQVILCEARQRRGLPPKQLDVQVFHASESEPSDWLWARWAAAGEHRGTALKHAFRGLRRAPLTPRSWVVLARCLLPHTAVRFGRRFLRSGARHV